MTYHMKLKSVPFYSIRARKKTIELRLYDEKRKKLRIGDLIEFTCLDQQEFPLYTRVIALHPFDSFAELYSNLPLERCGYTLEDITAGRALPSDMERYYPLEEQQKYGVVGIEIELLSEHRGGKENVLSEESSSRKNSGYFTGVWNYLLTSIHYSDYNGFAKDKDGWVSVDDLIEKSTYPLTRKMIMDVIEHRNGSEIIEASADGKAIRIMKNGQPV